MVFIKMMYNRVYRDRRQNPRVSFFVSDHEKATGGKKNMKLGAGSQSPTILNRYAMMHGKVKISKS